MSAVMTASRLRPEDESDEFSLEESYAKEVGRRITQARRELGITQVEFAKKVGASQRSAQAWETGEVIPYRWMKKVSRVLRREPEWILHGDEAIEETRLGLIEQRSARIEGQLDELARLLRALSKKLS